MSAIRQHANGQSCVRCGICDGTVVLCHYAGPWQHRFGKGRGLKGNDIAGAELCNTCHRFFDEYQSIDANADDAEKHLQHTERSEEFLAMCLLTNIRRAA
jgi:hypothetical protein